MNRSDWAFKDLLVWKKSIDFAKQIVHIISLIDSDRKHFRLFEQIESSSTSISNNIAEGKGRLSRKEYKQFLYIARGSLYETISMLNLFHEMEWIDSSTLNLLENKGLEINKMLNGLIQSIEA